MLCRRTRSDIATGHFPGPPLQQGEVSFRTICLHVHWQKIMRENGISNSLLILLRTTCQDNHFAKAVSSILLQPCWILVLCLPARWFKLIQQFFGSKWLHCVLHWNGSLWLNLGDEHSYLFVFSLISCLLWFIHFEVVIMMSTDNCCMLCGCRFLHLPWTASDTAPVMRRTYLLLCVSFILEFLLPVQSLHYQVARLPGNPPVHCRRLRRVSCVMRPAVQHCLSQAVGFRCAHCTSEFDTRHAMDCHRRKQSSLGTGCADPSNSKSVSYTGRASISSSIIREHDVLGALTIHSNISHGDRKCTYTVASFQINV